MSTCQTCGKELAYSGAYCCDAENERRLAEGRAIAAERKARGEVEKVGFWGSESDGEEFICKKCHNHARYPKAWHWKEEGLCYNCRPGSKSAL